MENTQTAKKRSVLNVLQRVPQSISTAVENFFYRFVFPFNKNSCQTSQRLLSRFQKKNLRCRLGYEIARHPLKWIFGCTLVVLVCLFGLYRFKQEKNPLKLWIPPDSDFVRDTEWLMANFKEGRQVEQMIMTGENILEPEALVEVNGETFSFLKSKANE